MIADIFHPIFTLTITILACFIRKKAKLFRDLHTHVYHIFTKASPWPPGGLPPSPASIVSGFACAHAIFLLYYLLTYLQVLNLRLARYFIIF